MSSQTGLVVPPGYSAPFATITPDDHEAWILIAAALGLACYLFFGCIRIVVRITISHGFALDDYVLGAATLLAVIQSSLVLGGCSKGLGKSSDILSAGAQDEVQKIYYTANLFYILIIGLSKISVICFLSRISRMKQHRIVFNIAMGLITAWMVASFFAMALQCNLKNPWIIVSDEGCSGTSHRWLVIGVLDIVSEVAIVGLVVFLVYTLQTSIASKLTVVAIFSFRLFTIIFIGCRLNSFNQAGYKTNPLLFQAPFIAWTQGHITYALISATIPTFQNFLKNLSTGFGGIGSAAGYGYGYASGSGSANRTRGRMESNMSFQMSKMRSANKSVGFEEPDEEPERGIGHASSKSSDAIHGVTNGTTIGPWSTAGSKDAANNGETTSIASDESRRMMIRKEIQWSVRTEDR